MHYHSFSAGFQRYEYDQVLSNRHTKDGDLTAKELNDLKLFKSIRVNEKILYHKFELEKLYGELA